MATKQDNSACNITDSWMCVTWQTLRYAKRTDAPLSEL